MAKFVVVLAIVTVSLCSALRDERVTLHLRNSKPTAEQAPFRSADTHGHGTGSAMMQQSHHHHAHGDAQPLQPPAGTAEAPGSLQPTQPPQEGAAAQEDVPQTDTESVEPTVAVDGSEEFTSGLGPNEELEEVITPEESGDTTWGVLEKDKPFPGMAISQMPTINVHQPMQELSPALTRAMMKGGDEDVPYSPDGLPMDPNKSGGDALSEGGLNEPWVGHAIKAMPPCPTCSNDCPEEEDEEGEGGDDDDDDDDDVEPFVPDPNALIPLCPRCLCNEPPAPQEESEEEEGE